MWWLSCQVIPCHSHWHYSHFRKRIQLHQQRKSIVLRTWSNACFLLLQWQNKTHVSGLHLLSHLLFSPGDLVFVEDPTYFLAMKMFEDAGLKVKGGEYRLRLCLSHWYNSWGLFQRVRGVTSLHSIFKAAFINCSQSSVIASMFFFKPVPSLLCT